MTIYDVDGFSPFNVILPCVPEQVIGWLLVTLLITGIWLMITVVVSGNDKHPLIVELARTTYLPALEVSAFVMDGFCNVELKLAGPDHMYVALATFVACRLSVLPAHNAPLLVAVGFAGRGLIVTDAVSGKEEQ